MLQKVSPLLKSARDCVLHIKSDVSDLLIYSFKLFLLHGQLVIMPFHDAESTAEVMPRRIRHYG
jgi:hypothetical protein